MASNILEIVDNVVTKEVTECSYNNCLVEQLKLVVCGMKSYSKFLHHVCQNNVDQNVYHGSFELNFGLAYRCPECMTFELQPEDCKMTCNKKTSNTPKKMIEENNIGKRNYIINHVSSEEEVQELFNDSSTSADSTEDKESPVIVIDDDDDVEEKDNNTSKSNDELNKSAKNSSTNEQCEESHVRRDNDDENQLTILEEKKNILIQFMTRCP